MVFQGPAERRSWQFSEWQFSGARFSVKSAFAAGRGSGDNASSPVARPDIVAKPGLRMRAVLAAALFGVTACSADAHTLQIVGTAGYLSEWEVRASAESEGFDPAGEHEGPITWKHVGLCTVNGPVEKSGNIRFKISGWGPFTRIDATMSFEQSLCRYSASFSGQTKGTMDCSDAKGIPLSLTIK